MSALAASDLDASTRGLELMSLQAIYPDEFRMEEQPVPADPDGVADMLPPSIEAQSRSFRLRVRPEIQLDINFVEAELMIALGPDYPDTESSLMLSVVSVIGLTPEQLAALEKELRGKITELVGREMVFELAQAAQDFLRKYNVDPNRSIHDEMLEQQQRRHDELERIKFEKAQQEREEARLLEQEQQAAIKMEVHEERQRRKELYGKQRATRRAAPSAEDLWAESSDESLSDDGDDEGADEAKCEGGDEGCGAKSPTLASPAKSEGELMSAGTQEDGGTTTPEATGGARLRWRRMERMEYSPDGSVNMVPELLGKGRFGLVYLAMCECNAARQQPRAGAFFAVKEMRIRAGTVRQAQVAQMMAEIDIQRKVDHPNVVRVFGSELDTGIFRIFLEYVPLGSVANMLRCMGKLDEEVVRVFTRHLLCAVACLHGKDILHRDIKPANLLLGVNGVLKLADFGESKWVGLVQEPAGDRRAEGMLTSMHGTTRYMAPEVMRPVDGYTFAADIWSTGCTVLEMLTGVMPFSSFSNDFAVMHNVMRRGAPPIPADAHLSPRCQQFLHRCLVPDGSQRASAADLLRDAFVCQVLQDSDDPERSVSRPLDGCIVTRTFVKYQQPGHSLAREASLSKGSGADERLLALPPGASVLAWEGGKGECGGRSPASGAMMRHESARDARDSSVPSASRYRLEFEELHILGEGGFGAVFLCRNRLDGQCYAIKKIRLDPDNHEANRKMLREVKTLSGLHHQSVVRYFQAWIEGGHDAEVAVAGGESDEEDAGGESDDEDRPSPEMCGGLLPESEEANGSETRPDNVPSGRAVGETCNHKSRGCTNDESSSPAAVSAGSSDERGADSGLVGGWNGDATTPCDSSAAVTDVHKAMAAVPASSAESAARVGVGSLGAAQARKKPPMYMHDDLMQERSVRKWGEKPLAMGSSWSDGSYDDEEKEETYYYGSAEKQDATEQGKEEDNEGKPVRRSGDTHDPGMSEKQGVESRKGPRPQQPTRGRSGGEVQILYIQMEYCEKTLGDVINDEKLHTTPERLWTLFRQLVAGIAYIHSKGIVHRDLKPKNVFLDFAGDIKIGDLGLARFSAGHRRGDASEDDVVSLDEGRAARREGRQEGSPTLSQTVDSEESSAQVGTYLYLAPEVIFGGGAELGDQSKRDVFALGIVLFEMWSHRFETVCERVQVLQELHRGQLPRTFEESHGKAGSSNVLALIRWLLNADPALRPTALQVLDSELLPRTMLESELKQLLSNMQSKPHLQAMLMQALFARDDRTADVLYDPDVCLPRLHGPTLALVEHTLTRVFTRHAAVRLDLPLMTPRARAAAHAQSVSVMDDTGTQFGLPYDSATPLAYFLARTGQGRAAALRRYSFGRVLRARLGYLPREASEAAFDITSAPHVPAADRRVDEAEVLRVLFEVLQSFPVEGSDSYVVTVSYEGLVHGLLEACHVPASHAEDVRSALAHARKLGRSAGRKKLALALRGLESVRAGALAAAVDRLWEAEDKGLGHQAQLKVLQDALGGSSAGTAAVRCLRQVLELACAMLPAGMSLGAGSAVRLVVDPALSLPRYRDGLVLHAGVKTHKKRAERVVATGGRYDALVASLAQAALAPVAAGGGLGASKPAAARCCGVVGVCFSVDRLCSDTRPASATPAASCSSAVAACGDSTPTSSSAGGEVGVAPACSVLVYARQGLSAQERLSVMGELWDNGIRAETPDPPLPLVGAAGDEGAPVLTTEQLHALCAQRLLDWILILDSERVARGSGKELRLKLMRSRDAVKAERNKAERFKMASTSLLSCSNKKKDALDASSGKKKDSYDNLLEYVAEFQALAEVSPQSVAEMLDVLLESSPSAAALHSTVAGTPGKGIGGPVKRTNSLTLPELKKATSLPVAASNQGGAAGGEGGVAAKGLRSSAKSDAAHRLREAANKKIAPVAKALNMARAEVIVCSFVPYAVLEEIVFLSQSTGNRRKAVAGVKKKHQRHGDELNKLEELLGNLRSTGMVFIFSARDDAYVMLPLI